MTGARPIKVCFLIPDFSDGGAQKQCIFLLNALRRDPDLDITLIHFHPGVHDDLLDHDGLTVIRMPVRSNYDPRNILRLRKLLRDIRPQVLMTWLHSCDVFGFFLRRTVPGMRWLMTERDSNYPRDPRYILRRILGTHADGIVANSVKGGDYWRLAGAHCPIYVASNIVQFDMAPTDRQPAPARAISIGRLEPQKNTGTVVDAFCQLAFDRPDIAFAVVGAGSLGEALAANVTGRGLADRIPFFGFRRDVDNQIRASGVVVSMSHHEGLPNVMLEAVANGRLVVASDIPEHRELLGDDYPYLVAERQDSVRVAAVVAAALDARDDLSPLDYARRRLAEMNPSAVSASYKAIYEKLGGGAS